MHKLIYSLLLISSVIGNPFYQMIAYIICSENNLGNSKGTNVFQANFFAFIMILVFIYIVRLGVYSLIFTSKEYPFKIEGKNSFLYIFSKRHVFQAFGLLSFVVWTWPLEGNIIGFFVFPLTLLFGGVLSIVTFIRILKTKKILIEKNQ